MQPWFSFLRTVDHCPSVNWVSCGLWQGSRSWNGLDCQNLFLNSVQLDQDSARVVPILSWTPRISSCASCWHGWGRGGDCNLCPAVPLASAPWHWCNLEHSDAGSAPLAFHNPITAAIKEDQTSPSHWWRKKPQTRSAQCTTWVMGVDTSACLQVLGLESVLQQRYVFN